MKHILITVPTYDPFQDGMAQAATVMAKGLAARGHKVVVATLFHRDRAQGNPVANPAVRQFSVTGNSHFCVGFDGEVTSYREFIRGFRGDCVICHGWEVWTTDLAMKEFAKLPMPKILVSHGFSTFRIPWHRRFPWGLGYWSGWVPYIIRLPYFMRRFSHLVFLSKQVDCNRFFDHLVARLSRHPGIAVIPNCADPERFDQPQPDFRKEFGISTGTLFLCVANFSIGKNQALALRAFRKARLAGATLVFIGSEFNDYQALLNGLDRELTELYPDGRVLFLEKLSRDQTMAAFQACDVFVLTSKSECQPIVLIEAMACHKPFISTESSGCIAELVGGVIANSEQEIGAQMKSLHENPDIRRSLGHKGWEAFQDRYTCNRALDAFEGLLC